MSEIFYEVLMEKRASSEMTEERKDSNAKKGVTAAGQLYLGKRLLDDGASKLLGVQRFVHGTSDKNAKSILREGLKSRYGGSAAGSSAGLGGEAGKNFMKRSKGKVHLFEDNFLTRRLASGHANLAETMGGADAHIAGILGGGKGKKLYGEIDYDTYKKLFEADPDYGLSYARASKARKNVNVAAHSSRGGLGRMIKSRSKNLPKYLKEHSGRALQGAALTAGAAYLGNKAYKNIKSIAKDHRAWKRENEKRASLIIEPGMPARFAMVNRNYHRKG